MKTLVGLAISPGIAIGRAVFLNKNELITCSSKDDPFILISEFLSPLDISVNRNLHLSQGIIFENGTSASHSAFILRSLDIPAVFGVKHIRMQCSSNSLVIVDGINGKVVIDPTLEDLEQYRTLAHTYRMNSSTMHSDNISIPVKALDGERVGVWASVGSLDDVRLAFKKGADGIGVLRSEFLFLNNHEIPKEDEHFNVYNEIAALSHSKPIVIRILDIGADKAPMYMKIPHEDNPFLGMRGIRYCLKHPELILNQINAIYRASKNGDIRILLPMVSRLDEVEKFKLIMDEVTQSGNAMKIGAMIEVPAAVEIINELSELVDFFSIGTNDLIQYMEAVDRTSDTVIDKYDPFHPAIIRTIARTVKKAKANKKWIGICGEMARNPLFAPFFIGLGTDELTVPPKSIPYIKTLISKQHTIICEEISEELILAKNSNQVLQLLCRFADANMELGDFEQKVVF